MATQYSEPLIIGCHHKTGTKLLSAIIPIMADRLWRSEQIVRGTSEVRKLPLSRVLQTTKKGFSCYANIWFEHEVDVPASSIRFIHFIRHPVKWIRSAYLYHKKGGPSEGSKRWLDWRVFRVGKTQLSYCELLNAVDDNHGLLIEAVRSFPEVAGTARASASSIHLTMKYNMTLEQLYSDFDRHIISLCQFVGLDVAEMNDRMSLLREHDLSRMSPGDRPPHVTQGSKMADRLEVYLVNDPGFRRLYGEITRQMGFTFHDGDPGRTQSLLSSALVDRIFAAREYLLTGPSSDKVPEFLRSNVSGTAWFAYALQSFGGAGHLMMYDFIQEMIDKSE